MLDSLLQANTTKVCNKCGVVKTLAEFPIDGRAPTGRAGRCEDCRRAQRLDWESRNPEKVKTGKDNYVRRHPDRMAEIKSRVLEAEREATKARRGETWGPRQTSDGRRCSGCKLRKPLDAFGVSVRYHDGFQPYCRECSRANARAYAKNVPPEKAAARRRRVNLKMLYGLSVEAFDALLASQGHRCGICREAVPSRGRCANAVDHDHTTGAVRGILCMKCNAGLGQFRDSPAFLRAAADYLDRSRGET